MLRSGYNVGKIEIAFARLNYDLLAADYLRILLILHKQHVCKGSRRTVGKIAEIDFHIELAVFIFLVKLCLCVKIPDSDFRLGIDINLTVDAAENPHILIFKVCSVAVAVNLCRDKVFARHKVLCDIEFGRCH